MTASPLDEEIAYWRLIHNVARPELTSELADELRVVIIRARIRYAAGHRDNGSAE